MKTTTCAISLFVLFASFEFTIVHASQASRKTGELHVLTGPKVGVYLDGDLIGVSSSGYKGVFVGGVPEGIYILRAVKAGHEPFITTVTVEPGRRTTLRTPKKWISWPWLKPRPKICETKGKPGFFVGMHFPVISRVTEQYNNAYVGGAFEFGSRVTEVTSISGFLFYAKDYWNDRDNHDWLTLNIGPNFHFGPDRFKFKLRTSIVLSHVTGDDHDVDYNALGAGISAMAGFEIMVAAGVRLGIHFGMDMLFAPHKGKEYYYDYVSSRWTSREVASNLSFFGGLYFKFGG